MVMAHTHTHTHTHTRLTALCPGLHGWADTRKVKPIWILLKQETVSGSGISWAICKSAPRSIQITTPAPLHSDFYRPDALPVAQPKASKHWREFSLMSDKLAPMCRCNIKRTDCDTYETELNSSVGLWIGWVRTPDDIEYELTKLNSAMISAYHKVCPVWRISGRRKVPWWNHELKTLRKAAFHKAYRTKLEQHRQAHRAARRVFKRKLCHSKRESWQDFCTKTEGVSDT